MFDYTTIKNLFDNNYFKNYNSKYKNNTYFNRFSFPVIFFH